MALILVRHGSTIANVGDPQNPNDYFRGGGLDVPMSDFGQKTSQQTAAWFRQIPLQSIISSPLIRAQQMAQMLGQTTGVKPTTDPRLMPWHLGMFTGQQITPESLKVVNKYQNELSHVPLPGSNESFNDFVNRTKSILPELLQASQSQNVAVVAHHRTALLINSLLYNKPMTHTGPPLPGGVVAFTGKGTQSLFVPPAVSAKEGGKGMEGAPS